MRPAPVKHQSLAGGEDLAGDTGEAAGGASLERIHPSIVDAQIEPFQTVRVLLQIAFDVGQILVGSLRDPEPDAPAGGTGRVGRSGRDAVVIEGVHCDIHLPNAQVLGDQGRRTAAAVGVEVEYQHRLGSGRQGRTGGYCQPVEGAEPGAVTAARVMQAAGERAGHAVFKRGESRRLTLGE